MGNHGQYVDLYPTISSVPPSLYLTVKLHSPLIVLRYHLKEIKFTDVQLKRETFVFIQHHLLHIQASVALIKGSHNSSKYWVSILLLKISLIKVQSISLT